MKCAGVVENRLSNTTDDTVKDYGLVFICAEENQNARICLYLGNHLVKNPELTDLHTLSHYVLQMLTVPRGSYQNCLFSGQVKICIKSFCRLIRSKRAGVGKSLRRNDLVAALRKDKKLHGKDITIPIYKTIDTDHIIHRLTEELGNGYTDSLHNTIHLDIAHEVDSGVDELLFNLIILRSIVSSEGVVWQAQNTQYYIIECMPFTRKVS
ncbi:hypothetical protein EB796_020445 [Bugula neritina]|uniref:Uncharacterized protein n=1 Tax=Bugula neritina TaxID=10212 RepID=A0A7J7J686_BUGNE|nr:hypothetical protein EB796_020445 [Bugula neritina]